VYLPIRKYYQKVPATPSRDSRRIKTSKDKSDVNRVSGRHPANGKVDESSTTWRVYETATYAKNKEQRNIARVI
jgi:hypothetical protein